MSANSLFEAAARFVVFTGSIPVGLPIAILPREPPIGILTCLTFSGMQATLSATTFFFTVYSGLMFKDARKASLLCTRPTLNAHSSPDCLAIRALEPPAIPLKLSSPEGTTAPQDTARVCVCVCMCLYALTCLWFCSQRGGQALEGCGGRGTQTPSGSVRPAGHRKGRIARTRPSLGDSRSYCVRALRPLICFGSDRN